MAHTRWYNTSRGHFCKLWNFLRLRPTWSSPNPHQWSS